MICYLRFPGAVRAQMCHSNSFSCDTTEHCKDRDLVYVEATATQHSTITTLEPMEKRTTANVTSKYTERIRNAELS